MPYPYLTNADGRQMDYREMRRAAGVPEYYVEKMPADLSIPYTYHEGVPITVLSSDEARAFWKNPTTNTPMRVIADCPVCGKSVAASRINQHARVHHDGKRRGY